MGRHPFSAIQDPLEAAAGARGVVAAGEQPAAPALLRHIVDEAQAITGARYAALGVLDADGTGLADFITVGLSRR